MAKVYLDYAAATPVDKAVFAAMQPYFTSKFFNPSASYLSAQVVKKDLTRARSSVAKWLGAKPQEIIFTAGGTEANNLAINGIADKFKNAEFITSAVEHESVLAPLKKLKRQGRQVKFINPDKNGIIKPQTLAQAVNAKTVLISIMYVNNEIGSVQPLRQIAQVVQNERKLRQKNGNNLPLYFHSDACQAPNYLSLQAHRLGVDLMSLNGGKIYGPKQSGALYVNSKVELEAQILGGGQEKDLRSGTENVAGIIGLATALDSAQTQRAKEEKRVSSLRDYFTSELVKRLPEVQVNGPTKNRIANNIHITLPGQDNERLMMGLDEKGISVGLGSACSASSDEPSHVLKAIGLSDQEARSSLRLTLGRQTTKDDLDYTLDILVSLLR